MKRFSLYSIIVHILLLIFFFTTIWFEFENHTRTLKEVHLVEKHAPRIQNTCELLGVDVQIKTYDDLLDAFEKLAKVSDRVVSQE